MHYGSLPAQCSSGNQQEWELEGDGTSRPVSLSVFGQMGDRFALMVFPRASLPEEYVSGNAWWKIRNSMDQPPVNFSHQWSVDLEGSGCVLVCGREFTRFQCQIGSPA